MREGGPEKSVRPVGARRVDPSCLKLFLPSSVVRQLYAGSAPGLVWLPPLVPLGVGRRVSLYTAKPSGSAFAAATYSSVRAPSSLTKRVICHCPGLLPDSLDRWGHEFERRPVFGGRPHAERRMGRLAVVVREPLAELREDGLRIAELSAVDVVVRGVTAARLAAGDYARAASQLKPFVAGSTTFIKRPAQIAHQGYTDLVKAEQSASVELLNALQR